MRFWWLSCFLLVVSLVAGAKGETTRIEIASGKRPFLTLTGPDTAGQFTVWRGPGTSSADEAGEPSASPRDFADWQAGAVKPPANPRVYRVRFYCAAGGENARESAPSSLCYGVRYAIDPETGQGYIEIPAGDDAEFRGNTRTIYRGVEGSWFRASASWEIVVRPQLEAALASRQSYAQPWYQHQQNYSPPVRTAVSATPLVTPKK